MPTLNNDFGILQCTIIGNELLPIIIDEQTIQNTQTNLAFNWNA